MKKLRTGMVACLAMVAVGADVAPLGPADHARVLLEEITSSISCDYACTTGQPACALSTDHIVYGSEGGGFLGANHGCMTSSSCSYHRCTPTEEEDLEQLVELLPTVAPADLQGLAGEEVGLVINAERGALQLVGCEGLVLVSVPFSEEQAAWFDAAN